MKANQEFASAALTNGQTNAIVKKLGGHEQALRFLRGETIVVESNRKWREEDGIIYFSVTSNGMTGAEWVSHLEAKASLNDYAKSMLLSPDFKPTNGVTTEVAVLRGTLFGRNERITSKILEMGSGRGFAVLNPEVACLIRDMLTDSEIMAMGLFWIVTMHIPIMDSAFDKSLLIVGRGNGGNRVDSCQESPQGGEWHRDDGFAFGVVPVAP